MARTPRFRSNRATTKAGRYARSGGRAGTAHATFEWRSHLSINRARLVERFGIEATGIILIRTSRGKDWTGSPFKPYSIQYQVQRAKKGLTVTPVDLRATGSMLGSIGVREVRDTPEGILVALAPDSSNATGLPNVLKARYLEEGGRIFMRLSSGEMRRMWERMRSTGLLEAIKNNG